MNHRLFLALIVLVYLFSCKKNSPVEIDSVPQDTTLTLISPNGGEIFTDIDSIIVKWDHNNIAFIDLFYSGNAGKAWNFIKGRIDANLKGTKFLSNWISDSNKVKLIAIDNGDIFDESEGTFSIIKKEFRLLTPNGQEVFKIGDVIPIKWIYNNSNDSELDIFISYDSGNSWELIGDNIVASLSEYSFLVNNMTSRFCLIKLKDINSHDFECVSDTFFTIYDPSEFDINFFPLKIGNIWINQYTNYNKWTRESVIYNYKVEIRDIVILNEKEYFQFEKTKDDGEVSNSYYRIDDTTGIIYVRNTNNEEVFYNLSLPPGKYLIKENSNPEYNIYLNIDEKNFTFGTINTVEKTYFYSHWISGWGISFASTLGIVSKFRFGDTISKTETLKGCVIDGVVYGDTTFIRK